MMWENRVASNERRHRILIVGAGPCGLGAAWRLAQTGHQDWLLVEREPQPGGLAASFVDPAGFTWDLGGHVIFSHYEPFTSAVEQALAGDFLEHRREAWIHMLGRFVPYPFQYNIHRLPAQTRDECMAGLRAAAREAGARSKPGNFGEWIDATLGAGIARHFALPYNRKIWGREPDQMDWRWVGERVAVPDVERIAENIRLGRDDASWGPNSTFRFPARGGTGAVWQRLAQRLPPDKVLTSTEITGVDIERRTCRTRTGEPLRYDFLISTMPLTALARLAGRTVPPLAATSSYILGLGLEGEVPADLRTKCWVYFPEPDCPFYRATVFSNYSPLNVPDRSRQWSLMFEICVPGPADLDALWRRTLASVEKAGWISKQTKIASRWSRFVSYSYPVPTLGRDEVLGELLPRLESAGVLSRGRFGAWKYEVGNMDHSFMQGVEAVDHVLTGGEERTLLHPELVNRGTGQATRSS